MRRLSGLCAAGVALGLVAHPTPAAAVSGFDLHVVWLAGQGDGDQANLDLFYRCLLSRSSFLDFWGAGVYVVERGSYVVPAPAGTISTTAEAADWLTGHIDAGRLPPARPGLSPIYLVVGNPSTLTFGACGFNAPQTVHGVTAGVALVKTRCWIGTTALRNETSIGEHELAEIVDGLLGFDRCAGDCQCTGLTNSGQPAPQNVTGLFCPGAPASTQTGDAGKVVPGWAVQKLSHQGERTCTCELDCDFTVDLACGGAGRTFAACAQVGDCCSGLECRPWSYTGDAPYGAACCKPVGAACAHGIECCGGEGCTAGQCSCVALGGWCLDSADCCAGAACDETRHLCARPPDAAAPPPPSPIDAAAVADGGASAAEADGGCVAAGAPAGSTSRLSWMLLLLAFAARLRRKASLRETPRAR